MRPLVICVVFCALATRTARAGDAPSIQSRSAVVLDAATGEELFGKDADEVRPIASTTKIFVAMAVRAHLDLDGWTAISRVDARYAAGGARTRLDLGQKFRNKDLLRAMLLASDNRAPTALGRAAGLAPDDLVAAMNAVARRLHLRHTRFTDPTGLRGNVSTAREMAIALRAALDDDVLRSIMREESAEVVSQDHYARIHYGSTNAPLVAGRWDVLGGKTGYTHAAGYCFIAAARFGEREIVMAFLAAGGKLTRFDDFNRVAAWLDGQHGSPAAGPSLAGAAADPKASGPEAGKDPDHLTASASPAGHHPAARVRPAGGHPAARAPRAASRDERNDLDRRRSQDRTRSGSSDSGPRRSDAQPGKDRRPAARVTSAAAR